MMHTLRRTLSSVWGLLALGTGPGTSRPGTSITGRSRPLKRAPRSGEAVQWVPLQHNSAPHGWIILYDAAARWSVQTTISVAGEGLVLTVACVCAIPDLAPTTTSTITET